MKNSMRAGTVVGVALFAVLMFGGPAAAQSTDGLDCTTIGYSDECPAEVTVPDPGDPGDPGSAAGTLPRTGSNNLPLARIAIVLIALGGAFTVVARRKRAEQHTG